MPRTMKIACALLVAMVVAGLARALLLLGSTSTLRDYVIYANNHAGSKKDKTFTETDIVNAIHSVRQGSLTQAAIIGIALLLLTWALRSSRTASASRWALLVVFFFTEIPFSVIPIQHLPVPAQVAGVLVGVASIGVLAFVFVPKPSQQYFRDCREANLPPEMRGQPRPGLGSLFGPKRAQKAADSVRTQTEAGADPARRSTQGQGQGALGLRRDRERRRTRPLARQGEQVAPHAVVAPARADRSDHRRDRRARCRVRPPARGRPA